MDAGKMGALAAKRLLSLHHHPLRPLSGPSARAAPLDFLQRFQAQQEGGVTAFFSPAALVVGEGGEGVGGEHDFRKFLSSVSGAGSQGAGFHVHQAAAFLAAAPDFSSVSRKKPSLVQVTAGEKGRFFFRK